MGENNSKWNNWQRINFQNIQAAHKTQCQKNSIKNFEEDLNRYFSKEDIQIVTNSRKNVRHCSLLEKCKSKPWDITSHQSEWPSSKSLQTVNTGEGVEKRECSCSVALALLTFLTPFADFSWRVLPQWFTGIQFPPSDPLSRDLYHDGCLWWQDINRQQTLVLSIDIFINVAAYF